MRVLKLNFARAIGFGDGGRVSDIGGGVGYPPKTPYKIINNIKKVFTVIKKYAIIYYVNSERRRINMILDSKLNLTDFNDLKRVTFLTRDYLERRY